MSITFYEGGNLSGRSAALRDCAWSEGQSGQYLHPNLATNHSGLARTVGGELILHGLDARQAAGARSLGTQDLVGDLDPAQRLTSLSGGQQARVAIACALAARPRRLALDDVLEQLDRSARARLISTLVDAEFETYLSDNDSADLRRHFTSVRVFDGGAGGIMNRALLNLAESLPQRQLEAPPLRLDDVHFAYPNAKALFRGLNFTFVAGRPYVLKAPNGAGKSTLAKLIAGVIRPRRGALLVDERRHASWSSSTNLMFYAFQNPLDQIVGATAAEYLGRLHARALVRPTFLDGGLDLSVGELIRGGGIEAFAETEAFDLPPFVAKRLSIFAALLSRSPWLFFDEPSLGSDAEGREGLKRLFNNLCAMGFGVVVVSHGTEFDDLPSVQPITIVEGRLVLGGAS